jgi:hypothetical protein
LGSEIFSLDMDVSIIYLYRMPAISL